MDDLYQLLRAEQNNRWMLILEMSIVLLFVIDLVDAARHLASLEIDSQLQAAVAAYRAGDISAGDRSRERAGFAFRQDFRPVTPYRSPWYTPSP